MEAEEIGMGRRRVLIPTMVDYYRCISWKLLLKCLPFKIDEVQ
jgi:hypothetical protein